MKPVVYLQLLAVYSLLYTRLNECLIGLFIAIYSIVVGVYICYCRRIVWSSSVSTGCIEEAGSLIDGCRAAWCPGGMGGGGATFWAHRTMKCF